MVTIGIEKTQGLAPSFESDRLFSASSASLNCSIMTKVIRSAAPRYFLMRSQWKTRLPDARSTAKNAHG